MSLNRPLLVNFAIPRTGSDVLPGKYDQGRMVWMVDVNGESRPLVQSAVELAELATKTKVQAERDDLGYSAALQSVTKTLSAPERDDVVPADTRWFLSLATKTEAQQERDD